MSFRLPFVQVFRLNSYVGGFGIIVIFFEVVYLGFTLFFFGKMCKDLKKQKLKYFKVGAIFQYIHQYIYIYIYIYITLLLIFIYLLCHIYNDILGILLV